MYEKPLELLKEFVDKPNEGKQSMKRSISITSLSSDDSVILIDLTPTKTSFIKASPKTATSPATHLQFQPNIVQTRSKSSSNLNLTNSTVNSKQNSFTTTSSTVTSATTNQSPHASASTSIYIDSETTSCSSDTNNFISSTCNKDDDLRSFASLDLISNDKMSIVSTDSSVQNTDFFNLHRSSYKRHNRLKYNFATYAREDHGAELYNVQIYNTKDPNPSVVLFATVGSNRCSIYEYIPNEEDDLNLLESHMDADAKESYYTCCWTNDYETNEPLLLIAGFKGIIRSILLTNKKKEKIKHALFGHGSSINDLRIHPNKASILLSSSRDGTLRLWNLKSNLCIGIFGGCEGHRDEVLSAVGEVDILFCVVKDFYGFFSMLKKDFNLSGSLIISCSIDHTLKMWNLNNPKIKNAIDESEAFGEKQDKIKLKFYTFTHHFPDYTTSDVHSNYIDCVRWFGDFVLSKSCENSIVCWKPGLINENPNRITRTNKNVSILHTLTIKDCDIWFVRFGMDYNQKTLALGNLQGKLYVWNLDVDDPNDIKHTILSHPKCKKAIRSTALTFNGKYLIATSDDSHIWIWKSDI